MPPDYFEKLRKAELAAANERKTTLVLTATDCRTLHALVMDKIYENRQDGISDWSDESNYLFKLACKIEGGR